MMNERIPQARFFKQYPALPTALINVAEQFSKAELSPTLIQLLQTRVSQINRCGYCLDMHSTDARKAGEDQQRLDVLPAWREVPWFDAAECAALDWCETLTRIAEGHPSDAQFDELKVHFSEEQIVALTSAIIVINSWNRIVAALHTVPTRRGT